MLGSDGNDIWADTNQYQPRTQVIRMLGSDGNDIWADTNQYDPRTQSFLARAKLSECETKILNQTFMGRPAWTPKVT